MRKTIALSIAIISGIITIILILILSNKKGTIVEKDMIPYAIMLITCIASIIWYLIEKKIDKDNEYVKEFIEKNNKYEKKNLMTNSELEVYKKLKYIVKDKEVILQSQIVLSSILNKITNNYYANELYRIVDFGIFNSKGEVLCLIELNDSTHLQEDRRIRDCKVKDILEEAQIPLITIWTNKENTIDYLEYRLQEYIA